MRLELTRRGDYGVRAMLVLARSETQQLSGSVVAARAGIPPNYLPRVMGGLVRAGLVSTRRGRSGGYRLGRPSEQISVLAVIEAVEGDLQRRSCVLRGGPCRRDGPCDIHATFVQAQDAAIAQLALATLAHPLTPAQVDPVSGPDRR